MPRITTRRDARIRRHYRLRAKVVGTPERPRLAVFRSLTNIYAQVIDDAKGHTVAAASSLDPDIKDKLAKLKKADAAKLVGQAIAERAREAGVSVVVFDRGGYMYHGRVQALAEGARAGGLVF